MITHYIPIWARTNGDRYLAVCKRYVDYASDSDRPTCEDCRRLIAAEELLARQPSAEPPQHRIEPRWLGAWHID